MSRLMYSDGGLYRTYDVLKFIYSDGGLHWACRAI